jgi:diacylglycerol kinase (ATP)
MPKTMVIVNPNAGKGYGAKIIPVIERCLQRLGLDFDLVQTRGIGDAIEVANLASAQGYETIVAVGGDGTTHEVINGMMAQANGHTTGTLACIPAGSGNDFAVMNGTPTDIQEACEVIANGHAQVVDLGLLTIDSSLRRYFDNSVGIGFDGMVVIETRKIKHLRGILLYLPAVLRTIFVSMKIPRVELVMDGEAQELDALMLTICNGPREGGSFHLAPDALFDDGKLDVVIARAVSRFEMLRMVPRFMRGTHLNHPAVSTAKARTVVIRSKDPLYLHVDGEILIDHAHQIEIKVVPRALRMLTRF